MRNRDQHIYVGVDLHKESHVAVIINCWHEKLGEIKFFNMPSAFDHFVEQVNQFALEGRTPVFGLEDIGGYGRALAFHLLEHNQNVKAVNPALAADKRKSNSNPKKNDVWDALCVAKVLIDEFANLPTAYLQDEHLLVKHCVNRRDSLAFELTKTKKQLHNELSYHYPSYKKFFTDIIGKTALAFWRKYPSPSCLEGVSIEGFAEFLRKYSNNGLSTRKAEEIFAFVKHAGVGARSGQEIKDTLIQSYVRQVLFLQIEIKRMESILEPLVTQGGYQLATMPGISLVTAADFIAQIGDIRRFKNANKLAKYAGIAPYENSSGSRIDVKKSKTGDRHLHGIFYDLAVRQIAVTRGKKEPRNPVLFAYYQNKIQTGKTKKQAIVCIMRKLVNIIFGMMKHKTPYIMQNLNEFKAE
ncbi:IS110 family transposase [Paenibacillus psychroresistens]|uniref:IS110 family transposase n=1 Tax=Paenibacillus psychroresistens TaxID=1778678 RepID=A0A6B8RDX3_9BACL|nr:IS110 family transposase [Paenibacillus psychroresistens]QGQ93743.1 IS110 family transposase [Paenibacillus psychroresistens]